MLVMNSTKTIDANFLQAKLTPILKRIMSLIQVNLGSNS